MTNKNHLHLGVKLKEEEDIPKQINGSLTLLTAWFSNKIYATQASLSSISHKQIVGVNNKNTKYVSTHKRECSALLIPGNK